VLEDYHAVVDHIYRPESYFARVRTICDRLDMSGINGSLHGPQIRRDVRVLGRFLLNVTRQRPDLRRHVWDLLLHIIRNNPRAIKAALYNAALYAHVGRFSRHVVSEISSQIEEARALPASAPVERIGPVEQEPVAVSS
jgi:hypothetical protein